MTTVEPIRDEKTFLKLKSEWNALSETSEYPNVFTRWDWQSIWWKWFGKNFEPFILLVRRETNNELIGIVPFYRNRRALPFFFGQKHLNLIGYGGMTCPEYLGPIIRKGCIAEVVDATIAFLKVHPTEWGSIFFEDYDRNDPATSALAEALKKNFASRSGPGETRLTVTLTGDYDTYMQTLSYNSRRQRRKRFNQAQTRFGARIEFPGVEDLDRVFPVLVDLTTAARTRHGQTNPFHEKAYAGFHRELLEKLLPQNQAVLAMLYLNEKPAAVWYCFLLGRKCYAYQQGFSPEFEGSPSDVCQQFLIRKLTEEHYEEFDYLRGREPYKDSCANSSRKTQWLFVFQHRGIAYWSRFLLDDIARPIWRKIKEIFSSQKKNPRNRPEDPAPIA